MSPQARVFSIDALRDFRGTYARFGEEVGKALVAVELEIQRTRDWLETDQLGFWVAQVRVCEEKVNEAKNDLSRARISAMFDEPARCTDQVVALRKAQARLEYVQDKVKVVKHWIQVVEQEVIEYRGIAQQLSNFTEGNLPRALALLERMVGALDAYTARPVAETSGASAGSVASAAMPLNPARPASTAVAASAKPDASPSDPSRPEAETLAAPPRQGVGP